MKTFKKLILGTVATFLVTGSAMYLTTAEAAAQYVGHVRFTTKGQPAQSVPVFKTSNGNYFLKIKTPTGSQRVYKRFIPKKNLTTPPTTTNI